MSKSSAKRLIEVVGAVLLRDGEILAAKRSETMSLPGYWEFPGGKIEPGETPQEALERELSEELLVQAEVGAKVTTTDHDYPFGVVRLTTFLAELKLGEPRLTEHAEIRWVPIAELMTLDWAPADIPTVEVLVSS